MLCTVDRYFYMSHSDTESELEEGDSRNDSASERFRVGKRATSSVEARHDVGDALLAVMGASAHEHAFEGPDLCVATSHHNDFVPHFAVPPLHPSRGSHLFIPHRGKESHFGAAGVCIVPPHAEHQRGSGSCRASSIVSADTPSIAFGGSSHANNAEAFARPVSSHIQTPPAAETACSDASNTATSRGLVFDSMLGCFYNPITGEFALP